MTRERIYIASKTAHAAKWRNARASGIPIVSTWIDEAGAGETSDWPDLWARCVREASTATALVAYAEPGEVLKGALVEIGAALACGVPVYAVGLGSRQSVRHHPLLFEVGTLGEAFERALGGCASQHAGKPRLRIDTADFAPRFVTCVCGFLYDTHLNAMCPDCKRAQEGGAR